MNKKLSYEMGENDGLNLASALSFALVQIALPKKTNAS
jgi:hypothetical protein